MHSNIFQISDSLISEENILYSGYFYDNSNDFADYIGGEYKGENRTLKIKWLAEEFPEMFEYKQDENDSEVLIFKGLGNFLKEWTDKIQEIAKGLTEENIFKGVNLYRMKRICERTHHNINSRFFIEDWNNCAGDCADFISWLATLEVGTRIYVGAVIDYHF